MRKNVREENMCYSVEYFELPICKDHIYTFAICKNIMQINILLIVIVYDWLNYFIIKYISKATF
jgi:hypothetical protein